MLVTGASRGIGAEIALEAARNGYFVIVNYNNSKENAENVCMQISDEGGNCAMFKADVSDAAQVQAMCDYVTGNYGSVDVLVNNAGGALGKEPIQDGAIEDWDTMIDTNVKGLLYVTKVLLPIMCKNQKGHIVNLCSIAGKQVYSEGNVYCAAKHAVDAISKGIRIDALPYNVKVTNICPGAVETEFSIVRFHGDTEKAAATYKGFTPLTAEDIADTIMYCVSLPAHVCINDLTIMPTAQADSGHFFKK
jgi:NADP-dependent 3-hydroxy acid dehydrogenase YdfG